MESETQKIIRVFLASPGGLEAERLIAKEIVDEINECNSDHWRCQLKLIGWEHTLPGYERSQTLINQDLDKCQYFIGILWDHWGSPPMDGDGRFSSGFEEEYERAKVRIAANQMKDLALYFREIPERRRRDPGDSMKKVLAFQANCIEARKPLVKEFDDPETFRRLVRNKLTSIGWEEALIKKEGAVSTDKASIGEDGDSRPEAESQAGHKLFGNEAETFLAEIMRRRSADENTSAADFARLRLIASLHQRHGNDEFVLGAHDSNLLFVNRNAYQFSRGEYDGLAEAGLRHLRAQNAPLWYWISKIQNSDSPFDEIGWQSVFGSTAIRSNAIFLLMALGRGVPEYGESFNRKRVLRDWLLSEDERVFDSAIKLVENTGESRDVAILADIHNELTEAKADRVAGAMATITAATDCEAALKILLELDVSKAPQALMMQFEKCSTSLPTGVLETAATAKSEQIRRLALQTLRNRNALTTELAETLFSDSDLTVRRHAVEHLVASGREFDEDSIREMLTAKPTRRGSLGNALLGFGSLADESSFDDYRRNQLTRLSYTNLLSKVTEEPIVLLEEYKVLYSVHFKKHAPQTRAQLVDRFEQYIAGKVSSLKRVFGELGGRSEKAISLVQDQKPPLIQLALDSLCRVSAEVDLALVRDVIDSEEVRLSEEIASYLGKHGGWPDVRRILTLLDASPISFATLLDSDFASRIERATSALYSISRQRLGDLLALNLSSSVIRELFQIMSQKDFRTLSEDLVLSFLNHEDEDTRKSVAAAAVRSMQSNKVAALLKSYLGMEGSKYYNVIFWLDLGYSMPRSTARRVAAQSNQWLSRF